MVYFDMRQGLKRLTAEEKGVLFDAMLDYAEFGAQPNFDNNPLLGMAWDFIRLRVDRDGVAYDEKCMQKKYAVFCREARKTQTGGEELPSYEEWRDAQSSGIT